MEAQLGGVGWRRISAVYGDNVDGYTCRRAHNCAADTVGAQGSPRLHPRSAAVEFSHMRAWRAQHGRNARAPCRSGGPTRLLGAALWAREESPSLLGCRGAAAAALWRSPRVADRSALCPCRREVEGLPWSGWDAAVVLEDDVK